MVISCLYVQTVTRQCFCFPNSQWGVTAHDKWVLLTNLSNKVDTITTMFDFSQSMYFLSFWPAGIPVAFVTLTKPRGASFSCASLSLIASTLA